MYKIQHSRGSSTEIYLIDFDKALEGFVDLNDSSEDNAQDLHQPRVFEQPVGDSDFSPETTSQGLERFAAAFQESFSQMLNPSDPLVIYLEVVDIQNPNQIELSILFDEIRNPASPFRADVRVWYPRHLLEQHWKDTKGNLENVAGLIASEIAPKIPNEYNSIRPILDLFDVLTREGFESYSSPTMFRERIAEFLRKHFSDEEVKFIMGAFDDYFSQPTEDAQASQANMSPSEARWLVYRFFNKVASPYFEPICGFRPFVFFEIIDTGLAFPVVCKSKGEPQINEKGVEEINVEKVAGGAIEWVARHLGGESEEFLDERFEILYRFPRYSI